MENKFYKKNKVKSILYIIDFIILNLVYSVSLYYLTRRIEYHELMTMIMVITITFFSFRLYNLYKELEHNSYRTILVKSLIANAVSSLFAGMVFLIRQDYGQKMIIRVFFITFSLTTLTRFLAKMYISFKYQKANIIFVGYENDIKDIMKKFFIKYHKTYNLSFISPENVDHRSFAGVDEVLISQNILPKKKEEIVAYILKRRLSYRIVPGNYEIIVSTATAGQIYDSFIFYKMSSARLLYRFFKRLIDIVGSVCLIVLSSPFMLLAILGLKVESLGSPVFYTQDRVTINNRIFKVIKFRSMIVGAEKESGAVLAGKNDTRITKFGNLLRKFRIDELPQFFNVLKGDMSLVGPRPERPVFTKEYSKSLLLYDYRHRVRAGLTGLAQISGYYSTIAEDKLKHDLYYIENYSLLFDIKIMLLTIEVFLEPSKAEGLGEHSTLEEILKTYNYEITKIGNINKIYKTKMGR